MPISPATKKLLDIVTSAQDGRKVKVPINTIVAATRDLRKKQHPVGRARIVESVGHPKNQLLVLRGRVVAKTDKRMV